MRKLFNRLPFLLAALMFAIAIKISLTPRPEPMKIKQEANIAKDVAPHVIPYIAPQWGYKRAATGFYVNYQGRYYIMTNKHVCDNSSDGKHIIFGNYVAEIIKIDTRHDLCLTTSNRQSGLSVAMEYPAKFDKIYLVGYPRGIGKVIREGSLIEKIVIDANWLAPNNTYVESYYISTTTYRGNSGSPVVNKYGEVIGVLFAGSPSYPTEGLMVPLEYVHELLFEVTYQK